MVTTAQNICHNTSLLQNTRRVCKPRPNIEEWSLSVNKAHTPAATLEYLQTPVFQGTAGTWSINAVKAMEIEASQVSLKGSP
jgi:hypothetical protein